MFANQKFVVLPILLVQHFDGQKDMFLSIVNFVSKLVQKNDDFSSMRFLQGVCKMYMMLISVFLPGTNTQVTTGTRQKCYRGTRNTSSISYGTVTCFHIFLLSLFSFFPFFLVYTIIQYTVWITILYTPQY